MLDDKEGSTPDTGPEAKPAPKKKRRTRSRRPGQGRPRAPTYVEVDLKAYISRSEAARTIQRSVTTMIRHEELWFSDTKVKRKGVTYYPRHLFEQFRAAHADSAAFRCYELFSQGMGPHRVVLELQHPKPAIVRQHYIEYLDTVALESSRCVLELDPDMNTRDWKLAHGFAPDEPIHPQWTRRALEQCAFINQQSDACDHAVSKWEVRKKAERQRLRKKRKDEREEP